MPAWGLGGKKAENKENGIENLKKKKEILPLKIIYY